LYPKNSFASSTVVCDGERVIALLGNSGIVCVDRDGHRQWTADPGPIRTMHGPGSSPVLYKDLVICIQFQNTGTTVFRAYDKRTGKEVWKLDAPTAMCW